MIIRHNFGYAWRHKIHYDTEMKKGTITLWSSYSGAGSGVAEGVQDPITELLSHQDALQNMLFGVNRYTEFQVGDEQDLVSVLAAAASVKADKSFAFISREGRKITFSLDEIGKSENVLVNVKVQYSKPGKMSLGEVGALGAITRRILTSLGYSSRGISKAVQTFAKKTPAV